MLCHEKRGNNERKQIEDITGKQKAMFALETVKGTKAINEIAKEYAVHPTRLSQWKKDFLENAGSLFEGKRRPEPVNTQSEPDSLYVKIA